MLDLDEGQKTLKKNPSVTENWAGEDALQLGARVPLEAPSSVSDWVGCIPIP